MTSLVHWLLSFDAPDVENQIGDVNGVQYSGWWSGYGNFELAGEWWRGAQNQDGGMLIDIGSVENTVGSPGVRARVRVAVAAEGIRKILVNDHGPIMATLRWVVSDDAGATWRVIPRSFTGQIANPAISDGIYEADIETSRGVVDRGVPRWWSHEQQKLRHPGDDGLISVSEVAQGTDIRWPP